ncbi:unnamed protein product (macronuclear) [Paramecium tetraurelia]|uniref:UBC core domain-containing protein n=1 Tax=Paramecium tetraurelia TaxID=5888 RepID=A0DLZ3_PARTE|nr:uncharacterized protein GSPATT00018278001 [Paramecium tetraurelia]CAK84060.1 unnamed protein product [Paramecium tetraurelia]|eukprot:XP_001451457.1 hypothetical protein (macronuclear) [Paramecium tetraurelia strain d4-2]
MQQSIQERYLELLKKFKEEQSEIIANIKELIQEKDVDLEGFREQILNILQLQFKGQKLLFATQTRIANELKEFNSQKLDHIKVYRLKFDDCLLSNILIILMKGQVGTPYEGGIYSFILKFPENFPFATPEFRALLPIKHPHIYPNLRLCTPTINEYYEIQQYSLLELLQSWYAILHREPNKFSLANCEAAEQYTDEFIKLQAEFSSMENPVMKLFKIQDHDEEELELFMSL